MAPTPVDRWIALHLAHLSGKHPLFDLTLQSLIHHCVLGGLCWAMALFVLWIAATTRSESERRIHLLTVMAGSFIAVGLALFARSLLSWPPPRSAFPSAYPGYIELNWAKNSFPSDSTTLYASISAGIYGLNRRLGTALWAGVVLLIALPRMYVGGHYLSDVLAGMLMGGLGLLLARGLLQKRVLPKIEKLFRSPGMVSLVAQCGIFFYLLQVSIEFRDLAWLANSVSLLREAAARWPHAVR